MRGDKAAKMEVCREILARKDRRDAARAAGNGAEVRRLEEEIEEFEALLVEVMSDDPAVAAAAVQRLPSTARRKALEGNDHDNGRRGRTPPRRPRRRRRRRVTAPH